LQAVLVDICYCSFVVYLKILFDYWYVSLDDVTLDVTTVADAGEHGCQLGPTWGFSNIEFPFLGRGLR